MERLTKIIDGGVVFPRELLGVTLTPDDDYMHKLLTRLAAYEDAMTLERAQELAQAEMDGRLVVLPVPVGKGQKVYGIFDAEPIPVHIQEIDCDHFDRLEIYPSGEVVVEVDGWEIGQSDIAKTVFLTREAAEKALLQKEEG